MPNEIKTNRNIAYSCRYHVVFRPKYRWKVLVPPIDGRLKTNLLETIDQWGQEFIEMEAMPDHVHLLVGSDLQLASIDSSSNSKKSALANCIKSSPGSSGKYPSSRPIAILWQPLKVSPWRRSNGMSKGKSIDEKDLQIPNLSH